MEGRSGGDGTPQCPTPAPASRPAEQQAVSAMQPASVAWEPPQCASGSSITNRRGWRIEGARDPSEPGHAAPGRWRQSLSGWIGGDAGQPFDGWLTTCCSQIGQIMLVLPQAYARTGLLPALALSVGCSLASYWTMWCLIALYVERKARLIKAGRWSGPEGKSHHVTQYHDVIGDTLGRWARGVVLLLVAVSLFGTNVSQIVASSSDAYYLTEPGAGPSKRDLAIVFAGVMQLSVFLPTLRHTRLINVLGLAGTTFTAWYIVVTAVYAISVGGLPATVLRGPPSLGEFYQGLAVIMSAHGGHAMALEIMDSMFVPEGYTSVYGAAFAYIFSLTLPHSTAVQLAWPEAALTNGNVYGILPLSTAKQISIALMLLHQVIAFALYSAPLYIMAEKAARLHTRPLAWRLLARIPVSLSVAAFAVAFPFYGTINAVVGAITSPLIAFALPAAAYSWLHRTKARQQASAKPPPRWLMRALGGWPGIHALNALIVAVFLVNGTGFGIAFSAAQFAKDVRLFSAFPACFQC